jgi:hypothetical protein
MSGSNTRSNFAFVPVIALIDGLPVIISRFYECGDNEWMNSAPISESKNAFHIVLDLIALLSLIPSHIFVFLPNNRFLGRT